MKTLSLDLDLKGIELGPEDEKKTGPELAILIIKNIVMAYATSQRGLIEEERRQFYKIMDAFESVGKEAKTVDLDDQWLGFLRKCKREARLMPNALVQRVEALIDQAHNR